MSRNQKIIVMLHLILWAIIIYSFYAIYNWVKDTYQNNNTIKKINDLVTINEDELLKVDTNNIVEINSEIKGWIKVEGTKINYPFVQHTDNYYYLNHSIDNSNNKSGWIFLDYRNNIDNLNKNTIIYGHNKIDNTMFGSLKYLLTDEWLNNKNMHYIKLSTNNYSSLWEIFSVYNIDKTNDYLNIDFNNSEEYNNFIDLITNRSKYNFNNTPTIDDYIITLSTCYNYNKRTVVHAKLIKKEGL